MSPVTKIKFGWEAGSAVFKNKATDAKVFTIGPGGPIFPNISGGQDLYVDKGNGNNSNDGLSWAYPLLTVTAAITANNTYSAVTANSYRKNRIFVLANTYTETLTVLPRNCDVIAVGGKTRLAGPHNIAAATQYCNFYNFWFRGAGAYPAFTIAGDIQHESGFHNCSFVNESDTDVTEHLSVGSSQGFVVEDCLFMGLPNLPATAIHITGIQERCIIRNNWISANTNGILVDRETGYGNLIFQNVIGKQAHDTIAAAQMTYGIRMAKTDGSPGWMIVNNWIEAVDGISWATADTASQNKSINNYTNQAGTATREDTF